MDSVYSVSSSHMECRVGLTSCTVRTDQVYLVVFGTGIRHRSSLASVIATIGGANAEVSFAGAQVDFVGLDQINMPVPRSIGGRGEVAVLLMVESQMANAAPVNIKSAGD